MALTGVTPAGGLPGALLNCPPAAPAVAAQEINAAVSSAWYLSIFLSPPQLVGRERTRLGPSSISQSARINNGVSER
jgi:hypothetical protein